MRTIGHIFAVIRDAALAREPTPVFLASFLIVSGLLFIAAYQIGH